MKNTIKLLTLLIAFFMTVNSSFAISTNKIEKLIKKFALINSNKRLGDREYNEMYVSNPKIQGVFAYSKDNKVGEISTFMNEQKDFLKDYAKDNDVPFVVFGD